jgi:hypothetical protein
LPLLNFIPAPTWRDLVDILVNLKGLAAGKHSIRLTGKNVDLPSGVKVEQIIPQSIEITLPEDQPANQSN